MDENTYLYDPESEAEMVRLERQGRLMTQAVGLLPACVDLSSFRRVLDIGSGPGDWVLDLAKRYPDLEEVIGIDISERMISHASAAAILREAHNATFRAMNALRPTDFPDESFDLVNLRLAVGFIPRGEWPDVFRECWRLLRSGGLLVSGEGDGGVYTYHSPATAQLGHWLAQALWVRNLGFWDGFSSLLGIHPMQLAFFRANGFQDIQQELCLIDSSFGSPQYKAWLDHQKITVQHIRPLVCGRLGVSEEVFDATLEKSMQEARQDTYHAGVHYQAVVGRKP